MAAYLKSRGKAIGVFALFCTVFLVVFRLYSLPVQAVGYAALICAVPGSVLLVLDFERFLKKRAQLRQLTREGSAALELLSAPTGVLEADYQALAKALRDENERMRLEMTRRYDGLKDYYTAWAHQIKTPIAAMRLLLQTADTPENRELAAELQRVEQYVEMVLCYVRLDSSSTDYVIRRVPLDDVVRQALRAASSQFIRGRIHLNYVPAVSQVLTDEKWLLFVLGQLLSNALKYTPPGGSITISEGEGPALIVQDSGIGIPPEDLPRVTESGFTGENGRRDKRATGIGLYLCRRILKGLGHSIEITSQPGSGTRVRVGLESRACEYD